MAAAEFLRGGEPVPTPQQRTSNDLDGRGTPRTLKTLQQKLFANFQEEIEKTSGNTKGFLSTLNAVLLGPSPNKVRPDRKSGGNSVEEQKVSAAGARDRLNSDDFVEVYGDDAAGLAAQVDDVDQDEDSEYDTEYYDEEESKEEQKMPAGSPPRMKPEKAPRLTAA